jgi:hypothetical protein
MKNLPLLSSIKVEICDRIDMLGMQDSLSERIVKIELLYSYDMSSDLLLSTISAKCPQLKVLTVSNATDVGCPSLLHLAQRCSHLESVTLYDCQVSDRDVVAFCEGASMCRLHTLHIESSGLMLCRNVVHAVASSLTGLKHLSLGKAYPLQSLRLSEWPAWKQSLGDLARNCPGLRTLRLNWETLKVLVDGAEPLVRLFAIEDLTVDGFLEAMNAPEQFKRFASCLAAHLVRSIRRLALYAPPGAQGDAFLRALTQAQRTLHIHAPDRLLESVHFCGCFTLTDAAVVDLISAHPRLHTVRLEDAYQLTNAVLAALCDLGPALQVAAFPHSSLIMSEMADVGTVQLACCCPNLTAIDLTASRNIQDSSIDALAAHCPRLQTCAMTSAALLSFSALQNLCRRCRRLQWLHVSSACVQTEDDERKLQDLYEVSRLKLTVA